MKTSILSRTTRCTRPCCLLLWCLVVSQPALAQSNAHGFVYGAVGSGVTAVDIEDLDNGQVRSFAVSADGRFRAAALPSGRYRVSLHSSDGQPRMRDISVSVGTGTRVDFLDESVTEIDRVDVIATTNPIDVASVESGLVLGKNEIDELPVQRNITAVALLAPGTVQGDAAFGNLASFGGASVAENAYFINGFNVTNILNGTAFSELPFDAIAEQQIKTGGYGAEFGRSLGGVVNIVTQRGGQQWDFGTRIYFAPSALASAARVRNNVDNDGNVSGYRIDEVDPQSDAYELNVHASGPLIADHLYLFALLQGARRNSSEYQPFRIIERQSRAPQGLIKLDWNINDQHLIELTAFRDRVEEDNDDFELASAYDESAEHYAGSGQRVRGGNNTIVKWTGYLTDTFTMSALAGRGEYRRSAINDGASCPFVFDARPLPARPLGCWNSAFPEVEAADVGDLRTAWRIDGDWMLGDHRLRFGVDRESFRTVESTTYSGGIFYRYAQTAPGRLLSNGAIVPDGVTELVRSRFLNVNGHYLTLNNAWYIEDNWQAGERWYLYAGLRNEGFENRNALGGRFINIDSTLAPRLGFSFDVRGDGTAKLYASAGRYFIPLYANVNVSLASAADVWEEYHTFSDIDPLTGAPTLGAAIGERNVIADGVVQDPRTVVDNDIAPMYQDEFIIGYQAQLGSDWTFGARAVHRRLGAGMDDYCDGSLPAAWAFENGYDEDEAAAIYDAFASCILINPGRDLSINVDLHGDGSLQPVAIPAAATGLPRASRRYSAVEFSAERRFDERGFLKASWTISRSRGNTEGYVKSDIGQGDAGITQDFDFAGLMEGAYGDLPNDRRHALKIFGAAHLSSEWTLSADLAVLSGRPRNCFGTYAGAANPEAASYGPASFYCDASDDGVFNSELRRRGQAGRGPWTTQVSAGLRYAPNWTEHMAFEFDVINLFNAHTPRSAEEQAEDAGGEPRADYLFPKDLTPGRQVRFGMSYDF